MKSYVMNTKKCMTALLLSDAFDTFSFIEGDITTFCSFQINGTYHPDFFGDLAENTQETYIHWKQVREYCLSLIKGKQTPLYFHLIFSLSPGQIASFLQKEGLFFTPHDVKGLYLNFKYDGNRLLCTTGTSLAVFTLDKTLEHLWDHAVPAFFARNGLDFEEAE